MHGGGAARLAYEKFGAVWGKGEGLQGQSYAIPTMQGGVETIKPYVLRFIDYAALHPDLIFLVTKIGCGIAGFREEEIAPLFASAGYYPNIILPESFVRIIHDRPKSMPSAVKDMIYGQTRTLVDILREMDKEEPITNAEVASERLDRFFSKNLRGDETGFNSMRAVWCLLSAGFSEAGRFDVDKFEKKLLDFDKGRGEYWNKVEGIYSRYCTSKIIRYVSFLNFFRRYKTADELREDLMKTVQLLLRQINRIRIRLRSLERMRHITVIVVISLLLSAAHHRLDDLHRLADGIQRILPLLQKRSEVPIESHINLIEVIHVPLLLLKIRQPIQRHTDGHNRPRRKILPRIGRPPAILDLLEVHLPELRKRHPSGLRLLLLAFSHSGINVTTIEPGDFATAFMAQRKSVDNPAVHQAYPGYARSFASIEHDENSGLKPEFLAKKISKIIRKKRPRYHYIIATFLQKLSVFARTILPPRWFAWVMSVYYKL